MPESRKKPPPTTWSSRSARRLIMALVGSLCFFLIEVFYRGPMGGSVRWVMFWFVIAIVLISRIAIEKSSEHAAFMGWRWRSRSGFTCFECRHRIVLGVVLLGIVWFCANKLVWDCTLIDDDEDSSGTGLLQKPEPEPDQNRQLPSQSKTKAQAEWRPVRRDAGWFIFRWRRCRFWHWPGFASGRSDADRAGWDWLFLLFIWRRRWDCSSRPVFSGCAVICASAICECRSPLPLPG